MSSDDIPFERAEPAGPPDEASSSGGPGFRTTLVRVMVVQIVTLILLWVLQTRYTG